MKIGWTVLLVLLLPGAAACGDACANELIEQKRSPDGSHRAVLFTRNCGATTGFNFQVAILDDQNQLVDADPVFVADNDHSAAATETQIVEIRWLGPDELLINHHSSARIFKQRSALGPVRVTYQVRPVTT